MRSFCKHLGRNSYKVYTRGTEVSTVCASLGNTQKRSPRLRHAIELERRQRGVMTMDASNGCHCHEQPPALPPFRTQRVCLKPFYECDTAIIPTNMPIAAPAKAKAELKVTKGCWGEGGGNTWG